MYKAGIPLELLSYLQEKFLQYNMGGNSCGFKSYIWEITLAPFKSKSLYNIIFIIQLFAYIGI